MMIADFKRLLQLAHDTQVNLEELPGISKEKSNVDLESVVRDKDLYEAVSKLYYNGHHAQAVEKAFKYLNKLVKQKSGRTDLDGSSLMQTVFTPKNPILRLNSLTSQSEQDEQLGYMSILAGTLTGIRNPRAHEPDWEDTSIRALQLLSLANHLVEIVRSSTKVTS